MNGSTPEPPGQADKQASTQLLRVEGTNVVRVPFGVREARRRRPARPDHWATLVLPFQPGGGDPNPPYAA
jgi:hypothetical protein